MERAEILTGSSMYALHDGIGLRIRHYRDLILFGLCASHNDVLGQEPDDLQLGALIFFFLHIMHFLSG